MFGRKRKKDDESVGLAGLGAGGMSQSFTPAPTVSVTAQPASEPDAPHPPATSPPPTMSPPSTPSPPSTGFPLTPGMMPTNPTAMLGQILSGHGPVGELVAQIRSDPEGFRQRMIAQAQAAGISTYVTSPQMGVSPTVGSAPQPKPVDVIDELTKAADLHHRGVLTDAEFEAYKKRLLGE